ncbi:MAG TPA: hybrid sensor histidine kinase/response regulator [Cyanobacteria bacterium UBA11149]|nr:hybrid sensor histidine kinase/response regulator [Cyanobacteria bacterium UBA11367]HBE56047.1 hybrid sensor histidine kinase/response regulator [Cyanobacteria bacterium UBA11366]HBK63552.1 hybrid sensor histidine kinase/response regulator [Cyanobacteria bacterium UBA11166]HBR73156.1 hybrid sensor histidine kinase/response regulator [Cyanobacteria bacterium UBA11159]HBS70246.1 hybrid sensor histidine kinase/response regulator [Cyanobacteria bacterium UBA11153]HBW89188.1 hybrid sensor histid
MNQLTNLEDKSLWDLFRLELEGQVTVFNNELVTLESSSEPSQQLETLMRASHSIKGAARMVSLDDIVQLAHIMEDCFVATQKQAITLTPDRIDIIFRGVDLLQSLSQVTEEEIPEWLAQNHEQIEVTYSAIAALAEGIASLVNSDSDGSLDLVNRDENLTNTPKTDSLISAPSSPLSESGAISERSVRVSAENLNRIMGLAGESRVEANWLQPFADSLVTLRTRQAELGRLLDNMQVVFANSGAIDPENQRFIEDIRQKEQECQSLLTEQINELELYARRNSNLSDRLYREVIKSNMRPFADGIQGFPRMVRDLARKLDKQVQLDIVGKSTSVDRDILKKLEAPLTHILRNAVDHGIETPQERIALGKPAMGTVRLEAFHRGGMLAIIITDDGRGINPEWLRQMIISKNLASPEMVDQFTETELFEFLFLPGFSTAGEVTEISGRGVGLNIAKTMTQEVGGTVRVSSNPGKGTTLHFQLPLTLSVVRTLLVEIAGEPYALPLARMDNVVMLDPSEIAVIEGRPYFSMDGENIGLITAHQVLELPNFALSEDTLSVIVISDQSNSYGLVVDRFLGEQDLVVRPLDPRIGKVQDIAATALMRDGAPILIVDVADTIRSINRILMAGNLNQINSEKREINPTLASKISKQILVVDDSITVREMERKLLQNKGYDVDVAVNGLDAWNAMQTKHYDLVVSDIDMPEMNGIELVKQIKNYPQFHHIPTIIISYRDREEDKLQGLEAGADYYLTKSSFQDDTLIDAVVNLIGR